ncbi:peptidase M24 [Alkalihalobacillus alcalophilus ATCC 27647 = CGMCC 1.3604]|uniref:Peptidase M24 n=1 Tax=Alkalihalobacillus alcalophilus ATCC 27647 = CGMCC 1.3604 TaxID=1218173 RepID=A0A094WPH5_ALKAL|nr:Xaa-Pro peptidase family protein [Alkalihalobacillus alcalophilus]KGA97913.1 Xaa-Pro dipeptidase [Alkalihalobacillus alcalophilus ATCC 27647 = CGMCC 1.3604]MED1561467.1 Xaa-Pro peptidase family protein [Alkalihalobacillus alcalophilus]THG88405.1 peptidase M24 [Alkalihalobacillus alcalophilus ATCC 27647 = CGMCC 1.3604]
MKRIEALRGKLAENQIDALVVASGVNRRYMTGFSGSAGIALISEKEAVFITDFRYVEQAKEQAKGFEIIQHTGPITEELAKQIERIGAKSVGFEKAHVTYSSFEAYKEAISSAKLVPVGGLVESLRMYKDEEEIKIMKEAAQIADAAFEHILTYIKPGVKEIDVSNELEFFMRKQGAISSSFDIIVASGHRSALPHGVASEKVIETGELVTLDYGAYYKGYCSDITRTLAIGEISDELRQIYETVFYAQKLGMEGIKAGITGIEGDALTRDYIKEQGYGEYFGHSTGHGLGMEVHEAPGLSFKSDIVLEPGMVVTVEPGIYIPNVGGTRIEDDILITKDGNESFTSSPKELITLG